MTIGVMFLVLFIVAKPWMGSLFMRRLGTAALDPVDTAGLCRLPQSWDEERRAVQGRRQPMPGWGSRHRGGKMHYGSLPVPAHQAWAVVNGWLTAISGSVKVLQALQ